MARFKNLDDLIVYENSFAILMQNGSILNCTLYKNLKYRTRVIRQLFQYTALIIFILGITGNSLGLYYAMKDKIIYIRVYLTRVFHTVNLLNYLFMIIYPVTDMLSEFHLARFRNGRPWNLHLAHYHFAMAKTLINFSFGVYVIFAFSQMIAITYPFYYKHHFTLRKTKMMLAICFFYYLAWYTPSGWWFEVLKLENICGFPSELIIYTRIFAPFKSEAERTGWIVFGFFRETFTRFLPILIILILNYLSIRRKKVAVKWRLNNAVSDLQEISAIKIEFEKKDAKIVIEKDLESSITKGTESKREYEISTIIKQSINPNKRSKVDRQSQSDINNFLKTTSDKGSRLESQNQRKINQGEREYKLSIRMLAILMIEFVIFLFPVSIYIITVDFFDYLLTTGESDMAFAGCTLLEYAYISITFYLNMIFNPIYRDHVCKVFRKSRLSKFYNKRKKNSNSIEVET
ncbi:unnamed protein product [Gordionus sp. m RMFG-2023]